MAISTYNGLMGSGKSYEVVTAVILPALAKGRRVVTNIEGIQPDKIAAYIESKMGVPPDLQGKVISCENSDLSKDDFFPNSSDPATWGIVRGGDLVCIDEAWRFWGGSSSVTKNHMIFFREHRHFVDPATSVSCDLAVIVQDVSDLHRSLKNVIEMSVVTRKAKTLGLHKVYSVTVFEGWKQYSTRKISVQTKKYDPDIFPLYNSYSGGSGKEVVVDGRQSVFSSIWVKLSVLAVPLVLAICVYFLVSFFSPKTTPLVNKAGLASSAAGASPSSQAGGGAGSASRAPPPSRAFSATWRIVGQIKFASGVYVVLQGSSPSLRFEHPSNFTFDNGHPLFGMVDGERVSTFSGGGSSTGLVGR